MTRQHRQPTGPNCEVIVHGNGFLANVRVVAASRSGNRPISSEALKPGDVVQLEIAPERYRCLTVQRGLVQWANGDRLGIKVLLMETDDQQAIDEVAWSYARGELPFYRWLRKWLQGDRLVSLQLSFVPLQNEAQARSSEAA